MLAAVKIGVSIHARRRAAERLGCETIGDVAELVRASGRATVPVRKAARKWFGAGRAAFDWTRMAVVVNADADAVFLLDFERKGRCTVVSAARLSVVRQFAKGAD